MSEVIVSPDIIGHWTNHPPPRLNQVNLRQSIWTVRFYFAPRRALATPARAFGLAAPVLRAGTAAAADARLA